MERPSDGLWFLALCLCTLVITAVLLSLRPEEPLLGLVVLSLLGLVVLLTLARTLP